MRKHIFEASFRYLSSHAWSYNLALALLDQNLNSKLLTGVCRIYREVQDHGPNFKLTRKFLFYCTLRIVKYLLEILYSVLNVWSIRIRDDIVYFFFMESHFLGTLLDFGLAEDKNQGMIGNKSIPEWILYPSMPYTIGFGTTHKGSSPKQHPTVTRIFLIGFMSSWNKKFVIQSAYIPVRDKIPKRNFQSHRFDAWMISAIF